MLYVHMAATASTAFTKTKVSSVVFFVAVCFRVKVCNIFSLHSFFPPLRSFSKRETVGNATDW